jgi:hypothetical protein
MSRFVSSFLQVLPHRNHNTLQKKFNWDSEDARQAGGEHRGPISSLSPPRYGLTPTFDIDSPEYGPGAIFGASGVYTSGASTSSASASSTASSTPSHSGGHAGAIAGGVIGGIAIISIAGAAIFYLRRRRSQAASAGVDYHASQPTLNDVTVAQPSPGSPQTMKFYVRVLYRCDYVSSCTIFLLFPST